MTIHIRTDFLDEKTAHYIESAVGTYIVNAGTNVAQMEVGMIEAKITEQRTMKPRTGYPADVGTPRREPQVLQALALRNVQTWHARRAKGRGVTPHREFCRKLLRPALDRAAERRPGQVLRLVQLI